MLCYISRAAIGFLTVQRRFLMTPVPLPDVCWATPCVPGLPPRTGLPAPELPSLLHAPAYQPARPGRRIRDGIVGLFCNGYHTRLAKSRESSLSSILFAPHAPTINTLYTRKLVIFLFISINTLCFQTHPHYRTPTVFLYLSPSRQTNRGRFACEFNWQVQQHAPSK